MKTFLTATLYQGLVMAAFEMKERRPPPDDNVRKVNFMYLVKLSKSDITYSPSAGFSMSKCYFVSDT